jgi:MarR family transcriptional regulator, organic hydroperoxide resistance regulator
LVVDVAAEAASYDCRVSKAALIEEALAVHGAISRVLGAATVPEWCRLDLTMAQLKGVLVLGQKGETPVGGLARELAVGLPAASAVVDRLVDHGLVLRHEDPADRRRTLLRLSSQGEELLRRLRQGSRELWAEWLHQLSDDDLTALLQAIRPLQKVAQSWDDEEEAPASSEAAEGRPTANAGRH